MAQVFTGITPEQITAECKKFWEKVFSTNGLIKNSDGTISVYMPNSNNIQTPYVVTKSCCEVLKKIKNENYFYDLDAQKCRWSQATSEGCGVDKPFKIVLNPKGNDGTIFYYENDETCSLVVDFDYLFKFDCDTLGAIMSPVKKLDPSIAKEITSLQNKIAEQSVICEEISSQLDYLLKEFNNLKYSITCEAFPIPSTDPRIIDTPLPTTAIKITPTQDLPFKNTGFGGGLAPFSYPNSATVLSSPTKTTSVTFCLTEPDGLKEWENILGTNRYQQFIAGDPNSYTCDDVIALSDLNNNYIATSNTLLYIECVTPFGAKTNVKNQIDAILKLQAECDAKLAELQTQLTNAQTAKGDAVGLCESPIGILETLDVSMTIDVVEPNGDLTTAYEYHLFPAIGAGNLYSYLTTHGDNSGFFVCGEPNSSETWATGCTALYYPEFLNETQAETYHNPENNVSECGKIKDYFITELFNGSGLVSVQDFNNSLSANILGSQWLHYNEVINDADTIQMIANKKIKISLKINSSCGNFCVLIDQIALTKVCTSVEGTNIFLTQSPGFNLTRIVDNKKSWLNNTSFVNREFDIRNNLGNNPIRQTDYDVNDERLIINTKEIDLDMNMAQGVETDVWCYLSDNPCLLTGVTICDPCLDCGNKNFQDDECFNFEDAYVYEFMDGVFVDNNNYSASICCGDDKIDFTSLLTTDISTIKTIEDFQNLMVSELINVKNRKTISAYPTLRALYERYLRSYLYCDTTSSAFDYYTMEQFANLVGNYWVDIIEQVIPATTIWGSVRIYTNTIFDQQKFKYKSYSSLFCGNPYQCLNVLSPINGISGQCMDVEVITSIITQENDGELKTKPTYSVCNELCLAQLNWGSEFIGSVIMDDVIDVNFPYGNLCAELPPKECINPMKFFIDYAANCENIESLLTNGLILPNCDFCCPDCEPYILASNEGFVDYVKLIEAVGVNLCCFNYATGDMGYDYLSTSLVDLLPPRQYYKDYSVGVGCENDNFIECLPEFESVVDFETIMDNGLVEHSTLNNDTALCVLADSLSSYDSVFNTNLMELIQTYGLVISCKNGNIRFTGIETYVNLLSLENSLNPTKPIKVRK